MQIALGVDGHKTTHTLVAVDALGREQGELMIRHDQSGYQQAYQWAGQLGEKRIWGIENSGHLARGLAQYLLLQGESVREVSPHLTGRQRNRSRDRSQSDSHDALAVARVVLQEEKNLPIVTREDETTQVKLLDEHRDNLVHERTRLLNQLHGHLTALDPHYKEHLGDLKCSQRARRYCQCYPLSPDDPLAHLRGQMVRQLATLMGHLDEHIAALEAQLGPLVKQIAPCLLSITGISILNAAKLIAHVRHIEQFASAAALAHYAGAAPLQKGSAGNYYHRVNPRGDRQLNAVFHRIAKVQSRWDPLAQAYLRKKKAEGKTGKHAFRCLKRKMVDIVYAVWKSGEPYQAPVEHVAAAAG
jgi:transposase